MECRLGCGACCIAPSISSPIPGMPNGKPAGVRCIQLDDNNLCRLFGQRSRPVVCGAFKPDADLCGGTDAQAMTILTLLEQETYQSLKAGAALKA
ncbi:YkgJ family cysteine cluster protein [Ferrimonas sediminicola]|uniref:YkgJ family cysteine cluster protein n=1 Tax=Ferrimonas sediminicola TaxID=2569538 RepID=A0A4U1B6S5_9GAMM|nr:YkgJ family cysteine cluster protein [Ferrimonas sediminicola]TKB46245.1 YkgJ family cysteine cluster protein [Ferrimonas sediminicola]